MIFIRPSGKETNEACLRELEAQAQVMPLGGFGASASPAERWLA